MIIHTDPFYLTIASTIEEHGRQIMQVDGDKKHPPFYHTIGNHLKGAPELLLIGGFHPDYALMILNMFSDLAIQRKAAYTNGEEHAIMKGGANLQVWDTTVVAKLEYTRQATEFYQHGDYLVQQVVVPDPKGHYPTDARCHKRYRVPVLRPLAGVLGDPSPTNLTVH